VPEKKNPASWKQTAKIFARNGPRGKTDRWLGVAWPSPVWEMSISYPPIPLCREKDGEQSCHGGAAVSK
jgi:hypothetical protein